ncbi:hypothetical protein ACFYW6_23555 [Streptomyces sp. NPDC002659]|uniref:hypothetical protein n=1 Tax=Streptomyces sp. NPDC002659 TaxID=3364656 RepID=UPI0036B5A438
MARVGFRGVLTASAMVAASLLASTVVAPAANAAGKRWGPIYAKSGHTAIGSADGDFANNGGVYATVGANWRDLRNDGMPTFVRVEFFFLVEGKWESAGSSESARTHTHASGPLSRRLRHEATAARAAIHVCVDRNALPDFCSRDAIVSFNY